MRLKKRFYLPKPLYELLPVFYLSLGTSSLVANHSFALDILGAWLIAQGLFKTILRVNYRSPRQVLHQSPIRRRRDR